MATMGLSVNSKSLLASSMRFSAMKSDRFLPVSSLKRVDRRERLIYSAFAMSSVKSDSEMCF